LLGHEKVLSAQEILLGTQEFVAEAGGFLEALAELGGEVIAGEEDFSVGVDIKALVGLRKFIKIDGGMKPIAFAGGGDFAQLEAFIHRGCKAG
jgi:hypothetical protein